MNFIDINNYICSYNEIIPGLWLSNEATSQSKKFMVKHNISLIVNCSKKIPNKFSSLGISYINLRINDPGPLRNSSHNEDNIAMITLLPIAAEIIHEALQNGNNVLVHCHGGVQRSATVVVYYLMRYGTFVITSRFLNSSIDEKKKILYNAVVNYVLSKRPIIYYGGIRNNFKFAIEQIIGTNL